MADKGECTGAYPGVHPRACSATCIEESIVGIIYEPIEEFTQQPTHESTKEHTYTGTHIEPYLIFVSRSFRPEFTNEHLQELTQTPKGMARTSISCSICGMVLASGARGRGFNSRCNPSIDAHVQHMVETVC